MNTYFSVAARELDPGQFQFLSVTIDPAHDTPEVLAEYSKSIRSSDAHWVFATGAPAAIEKLTAFAGLQTKGEGTALTHTLRTLVIAPDGRVAHIFPGNDWPPTDLIAAMKAAAR